MRPAWLLTLVLTALPATAGAQDIMVTVSGVTGRTNNFDLASLGSVDMGPITTAECDADAEVTFQFNMVDQTRSFLQFFQGSMCTDASVRNDTTNTSCQELEDPDTMAPYDTQAIMGTTMVQVAVPVNVLVNCTGSGSGVRNIWVLALDNETSEVTAAGQSVTFPIAFDFQGPSAPTDFMASDGENQTSLSWMGTADQVSAYEVFLVEGGCEGGTVTTDAFAGDITIAPTVTTSNGNLSSTSVDLPSGSPTGTEYAVAIRGVDIAGNVGAISDVQCISKVDVTTWYESYCAGRTDGPCGGGCAVASPGSMTGGPSPAWPALGVLGLAMALLVMRRRR